MTLLATHKLASYESVSPLCRHWYGAFSCRNPI